MRTTYKVQHISAFVVSILPNICVKCRSTIPMESSGSNAIRLFALFGPQSLSTIAVRKATMPFRIQVWIRLLSFLAINMLFICFWFGRIAVNHIEDRTVRHFCVCVSVCAFFVRSECRATLMVSIWLLRWPPS